MQASFRARQRLQTGCSPPHLTLRRRHGSQEKALFLVARAVLAVLVVVVVVEVEVEEELALALVPDPLAVGFDADAILTHGPSDGEARGEREEQEASRRASCGNQKRILPLPRKTEERKLLRRGGVVEGRISLVGHRGRRFVVNMYLSLSFFFLIFILVFAYPSFVFPGILRLATERTRNRCRKEVDMEGWKDKLAGRAKILEPPRTRRRSRWACDEGEWRPRR